MVLAHCWSTSYISCQTTGSEPQTFQSLLLYSFPKNRDIFDFIDSIYVLLTNKYIQIVWTMYSVLQMYVSSMYVLWYLSSFFVETISIEWQTNWPRYYIIFIECRLQTRGHCLLANTYNTFFYILFRKIQAKSLI